MSNKLVSYVTANLLGRDFVVGDLHGCLGLLQQQLKIVSFNPARDRLFSVGDLTDRGPHSLEILRLLREPWFIAVRGNHDDMLLSWLGEFDSLYHSPPDFIANGGEWCFNLSESEERELIEDLAPLLKKLPYVRTVLTAGGGINFHVAHAELMRPPPVGGSLKGLVSSTFLTDISLARLAGDPEALSDQGATPERLKASITWGRRTEAQWACGLAKPGSQALWVPAGVDGAPIGSRESLLVSDTPFIAGLSLTFVGHCVVNSLGLHASHLFIDRGGFCKANGQDDEFPNARLLVLDAGATVTWIRTQLTNKRNSL